MEINIKSGDKSPVMNWLLFIWKYLTLTLFGMITVPMAMWGYSKKSVAHRLVGKKSYFSKDGVAIVTVPDNKHPGRFGVYAILISKDGNRREFITNIYNGRRYPYRIIRHANYWHVQVDGRSVAMGCRPPLFTYNLLPQLSQRMSIEKPVTIKIDD